MRRTHVLGLFLWRSGLLLAGSYTAIRIARVALRYLELPTQLEVGLGLALGGALLVAGSLIAERVQDARNEDLTEP